ncbi:Fc.00g000760.m01.CDS01 [Cosmosporella sp. VM-42]
MFPYGTASLVPSTNGKNTTLIGKFKMEKDTTCLTDRWLYIPQKALVRNVGQPSPGSFHWQLRTWSIWAYKDINVMGMTYVAPESAWKKLLDTIIKKKRDLGVDSWAYGDAPLQDGLFGPLHQWFEDNVPSQYSKKDPWQWRMHMHVFRGIRGITLAEYLIPEWADYFKGKTFEELGELAASWKCENCMQRSRLNGLLSTYAPMKAGDEPAAGQSH